MKIPNRIYQIYTLAQGDYLWDIGCDHSLLARINLRENKFSRVYCVDKSKASLRKIENSIRAIDSNRVVLLQSDGCHLNWGAVSGTVVIAGVGGNTILKVVRSCPEFYRQKLTWVLNPFTSVDKFSEEIARILFGLPKKFEVIEKGRTRYIFLYAATE